jgi:hypothetical protein
MFVHTRTRAHMRWRTQRERARTAYNENARYVALVQRRADSQPRGLLATMLRAGILTAKVSIRSGIS